MADWHDDEMLTQQETAARLKYSVSHFTTLQIPHIGRHKGKRYRWGTVKQWIEQCQASTSSGGNGRTKTADRKLRKNSPPRSGSPEVPDISEALARLTSGKPKLLPAA